MDPDARKYWFPAKTYGLGWGPPTCWQGWLVLGVWLLIVIAGAFLLNPAHPIGFVIFTFGVVIPLIFICWLKGEPLHWRWGKPKQ